MGVFSRLQRFFRRKEAPKTKSKGNNAHKVTSPKRKGDVTGDVTPRPRVTSPRKHSPRIKRRSLKNTKNRVTIRATRKEIREVKAFCRARGKSLSSLTRTLWEVECTRFRLKTHAERERKLAIKTRA